VDIVADQVSGPIQVRVVGDQVGQLAAIPGREAALPLDEDRLVGAGGDPDEDLGLEQFGGGAEDPLPVLRGILVDPLGAHELLELHDRFPGDRRASVSPRIDPVPPRRLVGRAEAVVDGLRPFLEPGVLVAGLRLRRGQGRDDAGGHHLRLTGLVERDQ
jgi:hypothetical protein